MLPQLEKLTSFFPRWFDSTNEAFLVGLTSMQWVSVSPVSSRQLEARLRRNDSLQAKFGQVFQINIYGGFRNTFKVLSTY